MSYTKIITPFLMGQRREGLCRVQSIDSNSWEIADIPTFKETGIPETDEKIRRMGEIYSVLSEKVEFAVRANTIPVSIAGDCVSAIGILSGLQNAGKEPDRILWLDAHGDFHTWETTQTHYIGGMPLAMLVGRGDQRIVQKVGLRPYPEERIILSDGRDLDKGEKESLMNSEIIKCGTKEILGYLKDTETLYLHWDTDFVDAEEKMPALKYQVKNGPNYAEVRSLFESLRHKNIIAISVSGWHEEKDIDNKTAKATLELLLALGIPLKL